MTQTSRQGNSVEPKIDWNDAKIAFFSKLVADKNVLDIGVVQHETEKVTNSTWLHRALAAKAANIIGLDIDPDGVQYLNDQGYQVVQADAQDFQLDREFDVVVAGDLIEHLDNPGGFLESVKKHLGTQGRFAISTPNPFWWKTYLHVLMRGNSCPHPEHTCWFCEQTLTQLLQRHGYSVERIEYGTVYILTTFYQRLTKLINTIVPLPRRFRHNTIMLEAKLQS